MKKNASMRVAAAAWISSAAIAAEPSHPAPGEEMYEAGATETVEAPALAPNRRPGEGSGSYERRIIRSATLIDGTGAPPVGPKALLADVSKMVSDAKAKAAAQ
jgi:hypothetical protein